MLRMVRMYLYVQFVSYMYITITKYSILNNINDTIKTSYAMKMYLPHRMMQLQTNSYNGSY